MKLIAVFNPAAANVSLAAPAATIFAGSQIVREYVDRNPYTGDYSITPSDGEQVLLTKNLRMTDNITVGPIPSNYGLITWNGSTLTVS